MCTMWEMSKAYYENKKRYNRKWTEENTKNITIRFNRNDNVWSMVDELKTNGFKMNAIFKDGVIKTYSDFKKNKPQ